MRNPLIDFLTLPLPCPMKGGVRCAASPATNTLRVRHLLATLDSNYIGSENKGHLQGL